MYWAIDATRQPVRTNLLCEFHDINLCRQANVYSATSYQEMKNHQKNKKHLRSSCMQGFGVHFLYNFLMDFYNNEEIVIKQEEMLSKTVKGLKGKEIKRDKHSRFYFE
jgi:single-stranded DNA-specific DHH superfamily exonuclease